MTIIPATRPVLCEVIVQIVIVAPDDDDEDDFDDADGEEGDGEDEDEEGEEDGEDPPGWSD